MSKFTLPLRLEMVKFPCLYGFFNKIPSLTFLSTNSQVNKNQRESRRSPSLSSRNKLVLGDLNFCSKKKGGSWQCQVNQWETRPLSRGGRSPSFPLLVRFCSRVREFAKESRWLCTHWISDRACPRDLAYVPFLTL